MFHKYATKEDAHIIYRWVYADATERLAATGFFAIDVGVLALQQDNNLLYLLTNHSPIEWQLLGDATDLSNYYTKTEVDIMSAGNYTDHMALSAAIDASGSGLVLQVLYDTMLEQSGTSQIPNDITIPTITEGTQIWTRAITPASITNKIRLQASFNVGYMSNDREGLAISVFRGNTCIGVQRRNYDRDLFSDSASIDIMDIPAVTTPVTYSIRIGALIGGSVWYAGSDVDELFVGVNGKTGITLMELEI